MTARWFVLGGFVGAVVYFALWLHDLWHLLHRVDDARKAGL